MLVCGPAGVGKTRLADECTAAAEAAGRVTIRAKGSATASAVPLGALAHLLPTGVADGRRQLDPPAGWASAVEAFRSRGNDERPVLLVDDLHFLDAASAILLAQLVEANAVFLIGTVRSDRPLADVLAGLWSSEQVLRVDLTDFSRDAMDTLLHMVLGGPVDASTAADIWSVALGNMLFSRELVLGAQASGTLVQHGGVWRLTGPLTSTTRLAELIGSRLDGVAGSAVTALELLALAEPVGVSDLEEEAGAADVEALERTGLLVVRVDGRRHEAVLAHPLYGEVLRDRMPRLTRRRLLRRHAERVERYGARRGQDPLRIASWRLDADGTADPELLVAGARLARFGHDFRQAERLARAALLEHGERVGPIEAQAQAYLLLGEALSELGSAAEAETVLAAAQSGVVAERDVVRVVAARTQNLLTGLLRPAVAIEVNRAARCGLRDAAGRAELLAGEARALVTAGRPGEALRVVELLAGDAEPRTRVLRALAEAPALAMTGRCEQAVAVAGRGFADHAELGDDVAIPHPGTHLVCQVYALAESGRLAEATEVARTGYELATRDRSPIGRIWFALNRGRCALLAGGAATAWRWFAEADALCCDHPFVGPRRLVLAGAAVAAAWLGDEPAARAAVDDLDALEFAGHLAVDQEIGRAWAAVARGDLAQARRVLLAAADRAAGTGHHTSEAWLLHDAARLGDAARVHGRLRELADGGEGAFGPAYAVHARGAATHDPALLTEAADRFEAIGALLYAAEAATAASHAYLRLGEPRAAVANRARAALLAGRCEGARTPGLVATLAVEPLTPREREIAMLASRGQSSRQIAGHLFVSTRTVDNHLRNVYGKLGIAGRRELAAELGRTAGNPGADDGQPPAVISSAGSIAGSAAGFVAGPPVTASAPRRRRPSTAPPR